MEEHEERKNAVLSAIDEFDNALPDGPEEMETFLDGMCINCIFDLQTNLDNLIRKLGSFKAMCGRDITGMLIDAAEEVSNPPKGESLN